MSITTRERADLEALIDRHDLARVIDALAEVCGEKADHLRENWQDNESAEVWESARVKVEALASDIAVNEGI